MKLLEEMNAQRNDSRPEFIKFLVDSLGFRQQKVDDMIAQHNDITTAEDFLSYLTPDGENGL